MSQANAALERLEPEVRQGGIGAIGSHVAALEEALSTAPAAVTEISSRSEPVLVLVDGRSELMVAMVAAAEKGVKTAAVPSPYPAIAVYLGSYYNEVGKPTDALRVFDAVLELRTTKTALVGDRLPLVMAERGIALTQLKRWPEALANYDRGLTIAELASSDRALLLRGRGFCLIELGRLDEAAQTYTEALALDPDSAAARNELAYIAQLRSGAPTAPTMIVPANAQPVPVPTRD